MSENKKTGRVVERPGYITAKFGVMYDAEMPSELFTPVNASKDNGPVNVTIEKPIIDANNALKVVTNNGKVICVHRNDFGRFILSDRELLCNSKVFDPITSRMMTYNEDGDSIDNIIVSKSLHEEYEFTEDNDFYNSYRISNIEVDKVIEPNRAKKALDFNDLVLILDAPTIYHKKIERNVSNINTLVSQITQSPGQFDEIFTIEVKGPESPLLKNYLNRLADLIDLEIGESDEIDDIEALQKIAYEESGYIGKTLNVVLEEAKDFRDYFRFLLTKKEKKIITEGDYRFAKSLSSLSNSKLKFSIKKSKINKEVIFDDNNISDLFYFSTNVDHLIETSDEIQVVLFMLCNNILNISKEIESNSQDIRIGLILSAINKSYNDNVKPVSFNIFAFDENFNFKFIEVKSQTLVRYKKKFTDVVTNFDKTFKESSTYLIPKELRNFNNI